MSWHHDVKIAPEYFQAIADGGKTFEVRKNDRGYKPGDTITLKEWENEAYTGREVNKRIGFVVGLNWLKPHLSDVVVFSLLEPL